MDALNLFGISIAFVIGCMLGASLMYFGGLIIDRLIDSQTAEGITEREEA